MEMSLVQSIVVVGRAILLLILLAACLKFAWTMLSRAGVFLNNHVRPRRSRSNELGSADLASTRDVKRWLRRYGKFDTLLPVKGVRGANGLVLRNGNLVIPKGERNRHMLIVAKTGSGKTTKLILPILYNDCLDPERTTVVLDSKPEMWKKLAAMTRKYCPNKNIVLFNPLDTVRSLSWNILSKVENDTDAKLIANTIIAATDRPNSRSDNPFFKNSALQLLNAIMVGLLEDADDTLSMPRVHELLHSGKKNLCDWLEKHPSAIRNSRTFVDLARSGSQNADTILSELGMRLSAWDLQAIRSLTWLDELDLEDLIKKPTLFIIELLESEIEMLRPMANVIIVEILRYLTKQAERYPGHSLPRPVSLVIDEFASALGRLPEIDVKLNTLRSRNVSIVAAVQCLAQIKAAYGESADSVLAGFSTKIFMPSLDFQDAEWASKESGQMTIRYQTASKSKNARLIDLWSNNSRGSQEAIQQRAVLTPAEIGSPVDNICTFFLPNTPAFQGHLVPYYKVPKIYKRIHESDSAAELSLRTVPTLALEHKPEKVSQSKIGNQKIKAIAYEKRNDVVIPLTERGLLQKIALLSRQARLEAAHALAQNWWQGVQSQYKAQPWVVVEALELLIKHGASLQELFEAYVYGKNQQLPKVIEDFPRWYADKLKKREKLKLQEQYLSLKAKLGWDRTTGMARKWWEAFEKMNQKNLPLLMKVSEELDKRNATITELFSAFQKSGTDNIQKNLDYLDTLRSSAGNRGATQLVNGVYH